MTINFKNVSGKLTGQEFFIFVQNKKLYEKSILIENKPCLIFEFWQFVSLQKGLFGRF